MFLYTNYNCFYILTNYTAYYQVVHYWVVHCGDIAMSQFVPHGGGWCLTEKDQRSTQCCRTQIYDWPHIIIILFYRFPYLNTVRWYSNSIETVDWLSLSELFDWLTLTSDRPSSHFYYSFQNRNNFDSVSDGHCLLLKIQLFWLNRYEKWQQPLSCRRFWAVSRNPSNFVLVRVSVT